VNIISLCYAAFPGANAVLQNLNRTVGLSRHFVLSNVQPDSLELKFFGEYLRETHPALVIFGAWAQGYQRLLDALPDATQAAVYWTSSTGQVDISSEAAQLERVLNHPRIRYKFFMHRAFAAALQGRGDCLELPATIPVATRPRVRSANAVPVISLFCSPNEYRRKNILNSILAVAMQTRPYIFYLSGLSENPNYRRLLDGFGIRYRDWGWMTRQYARVLSRVDIGLQVSFAESFNYVAAEHVQRGIPVLVSRMVPALYNMPRRVERHCVVENPDDPLEIASKLKYLLAHPTERQSIGDIARRQLLKTNEENICQAKTLLHQILQTIP